MLLSRYGYYLKSILTLMREIEDPANTTAIFLGRSSALPAEIQIRQTGWRFRVRSAMDVWVIKETCLDRDYLWAEGELHPAWNIVDIGAGLGDFTIHAAKHCPDGIIHAYEPLQESFTLLQHNLALNEINNVRSFPMAVSAKGGTLTLEDVEREAVSTRFSTENSGSTVVEAVTLEQVLDALPGGECDFLKIDCEGCEFDLILNSPQEVLGRIRRISMEYHNDLAVQRSPDLVEHLASQGFMVRTKANPVHDHLGFLYAEQLPESPEGSP